MEMQDKSSFEEEWEKAFAEAESTPPGAVWQKIELDLANTASGKYKRRAVFFKLLAAASIFFAFSVGGIAVYQEYFHLHVDPTLSDNSIKSPESTLSDSNATNNDISDEKSAQGTEEVKESYSEGQANGEKNNGIYNIAADSDINNVDSSSSNLDNAGITSDMIATLGKVDATEGAPNGKSEALDDRNKFADSADVNLFKDEKRSDVKNPALLNEEMDSKTSVAVNDPIITRNSQTNDRNDIINNTILDEDIKTNESNAIAQYIEDSRVKHQNDNSKVIYVGDSGSLELLNNVAMANNSTVTELKLNDDITSGDPESLTPIFVFLEVDDEIREPELKMVPWFNSVYSKKKDFKRLWAGLGVSSGSFDPNGLGLKGNDDVAESFDLVTDLNSFSGPQRNTSPFIGGESKGSSLNLGLSFGAQVAPKWIIQSGVSFLQQSTTSTSNLFAVDNGTGSNLPVAEFNSFQLSSADNFAVIDNYEVSNVYRSISIPVQAGYILLDNKLNITLLGGVANDLLLSKKVADEAGLFESQVLDAGEVTNLNTYTISAIIGSEFGYRLGQHYSISLNPQLKQFLTSFDQTGNGSDSYPLNLELGFRLIYLIK